MTSECLIIRNSDRAIFEWSVDAKYLQRLVWKSYCFGFFGSLVRVPEMWSPSCSSEYEEVNRSIVIEGCKMMAKRK